MFGRKYNAQNDLCYRTQKGYKMSGRGIIAFICDFQGRPYHMTEL